MIKDKAKTWKLGVEGGGEGESDKVDDVCTLCDRDSSRNGNPKRQNAQPPQINLALEALMNTACTPLGLYKL